MQYECRTACNNKSTGERKVEGDYCIIQRQTIWNLIHVDKSLVARSFAKVAFLWP